MNHMPPLLIGTVAIELVMAGKLRQTSSFTYQCEGFEQTIRHGEKTCSCAHTVGQCEHVIAAQLFMMARTKHPRCPAAQQIKQSRGSEPPT